MKKIITLIGICMLILLVGCNQEESYYDEQGNLIKMDDKCLKEIVCQAPNTTETITFDFNLLAHESCYDLINDPDDGRGRIDRLLKEHPNNWSKYLTPHKLDPTIRMVTNNNLTEITCENIYIERSELE